MPVIEALYSWSGAAKRWFAHRVARTAFLTPKRLVAKLTSQLQNTYHERPFWTGGNNHATRLFVSK